MKDNFSSQSDIYAKYRPSYPSDFIDYIISLIPNKQNAWDCGTGNGQIAYLLSTTFDHVFATDISPSQIQNALQAENIIYSLQPAEKTNFENDFFDLIIVAQAIHWFDFEKFYSEVRRTAKKNAVICVVGYGRIKISVQIDTLITDFYNHTIGPYWDKERKYIDENYNTILFPFFELPTPGFVNKLYWTFDHMIGYLNTWSAVKHCMKTNNCNPVDKLKIELEQHWDKTQTKEVVFPLLLKVGQITK